MMRHQLWTSILACTTELDELVAAGVGALPRPSTAAGPATMAGMPQLDTSWRIEPEGGRTFRTMPPMPDPKVVVPADTSSLAALRTQLRVRLRQLWKQIEGEVGYERVRRALVIYFDERVMNSLPEHLRLSWPLMQTDITRSTAGGEDFYRFIEAAFDDPKTPSIVFEVHYFCLRHGFKGQYTDSLAKIDAVERKLLSRIEVSQPGRAADPSRTSDDDDTLPTPWPVWTYYTLAGLFVVAFCVTLTVLSNWESEDEVDSPVIGRSSP